MSNSISAMAERGWVRRAAPGTDRRVVIIEVTAAGRGALERVARAAEAHLAEVLAELDPGARKRLHGGLDVLRDVFTARPPVNGSQARRSHRTTTKRRPYVSE
jgi:DNA-binding MarR family transcriptional regulator